MNKQTANEDNEISLGKGSRVRLRDAQDVKKFMARCIRMAFRSDGAPGGLSINDAYKLTNCASQLLHAIEASDHEKRLQYLEQNIDLLRRTP
jgi:hypothetical protein